MTNTTVGIFGGGQLGRLLCSAASNLALRTVVLASDESEPAAQMADELVLGDYDNPSAAARLAEQADVITFEIETIGTDSLLALVDGGKPCRPDADTIRLIQNKLLQKQHFERFDIATAAFVELPSPVSADYPRVAEVLGPVFVQKAQRGGYDGRGVKIVNHSAEIDSAFGASLAETYVDRAQELAVLLARGLDGQIQCYPPIAMVFHEQHNILNHTLAPAQLSPVIAQQALALARKTVESLNGVGIFAVELFLTRDNVLLVNEVSPRVHNSGHWTLDGCNVSQFEQHLRAVAGLPLVPAQCPNYVATKNLLGAGDNKGPTQVQGLDELNGAEDVFVHLYGKPICYPNRKMGHVTAIAGSAEQAVQRVEQAARTIQITGGKDPA